MSRISKNIKDETGDSLPTTMFHRKTDNSSIFHVFKKKKMEIRPANINIERRDDNVCTLHGRFRKEW